MRSVARVLPPERGHFVRWVEPRYLRWLFGHGAEFFRARDQDPEPNLQVRVRTLVAKHPAAPPEALQILGADKDRVVREALENRRLERGRA